MQTLKTRTGPALAESKKQLAQPFLLFTVFTLSSSWQ